MIWPTSQFSKEGALEFYHPTLSTDRYLRERRKNRVDHSIRANLLTYLAGMAI